MFKTDVIGQLDWDDNLRQQGVTSRRQAKLTFYTKKLKLEKKIMFYYISSYQCDTGQKK